MTDEAPSSLGDRLFAAVQNLWSTVNDQGKVLDHHGTQFEQVRGRLDNLEKEIHGLKTSKGIAKAKLAKAEDQLRDIRSALN